MDGEILRVFAAHHLLTVVGLLIARPLLFVMVVLECITPCCDTIRVVYLQTIYLAGHSRHITSSVCICPVWYSLAYRTGYGLETNGNYPKQKASCVMH